MRIEQLDDDDWATFRDVRLRSLLDTPDAFGSTYGEESSQTERSWRDWAAGRWRGGVAAVYLGRDDDERPTGTITVAEYEAEAGSAYVYAMWVAPHARRSGVGRDLVDAAAAWARARGCDRLVLSVTETNAAARSFYEAVGFVETGEPKPLREGSDLQVLRLAMAL